MAAMRMHLLHALFFVFLGFLGGGYFGIVLVYLPALPLLVINLKLFDIYNDTMIGTWFQMVAGYLELVYGTKVVVTGDTIPWNEGCVIIMNHRSQMDWMLLWNLLARFGNIKHCKIVLKNSLKKIPGVGWAMQQAMFLFLARKWEKDQKHFKSVLTYFVDTEKPAQILLFPEGTDFCDGSKQRSDSYAKKNNLPIYDYVLYPRTRGFAELVKIMRHGNIKSVIDLTVAYPVNIPWGLRSLLLGNFPKEVHFNVKRYPIGDLPEDDEGLQEWCRQRWAEKEETLKRFYNKGQFSTPVAKLVVTEAQIWRKMLACLILWVVLILLSVSLLFVSSLWCWVFVFGTIIYAGLTAYGGVEKAIVDVHSRGSAGHAQQEKN